MFYVKHAGVPGLDSDARRERPICDYEDSTYRTDFWQGQGRDYEDAVERVAVRATLPRQGQRVVDIGAGFGRLADLYDGYREVVLVDYSRSQLEYARQQLGDERFIYVAADLYGLPLATGAVDAAVMVRVLHHIADVPAALAQLARIIVPQGAFVLEFANKRHLKNIARYLLRHGVNPFDPQPYEFTDLHYDFHPAWVEQRLEEAAFHVEQRRAVSLFRAGPLKRRVPLPWLVKADAALQRATASLTPGPSVFVSSRRRGPDGVQPVSRRDLFRCPNCGQEPLDMVEGGLTCHSCGGHWPIINGVYVFK
jgi:ubiquinone/menaquinone biosynthesis C-methylase UbiE